MTPRYLYLRTVFTVIERGGELAWVLVRDKSPGMLSVVEQGKFISVSLFGSKGELWVWDQSNPPFAFSIMVLRDL